jgi:hypothetical protein
VQVTALQRSVLIHGQRTSNELIKSACTTLLAISWGKLGTHDYDTDRNSTVFNGKDQLLSKHEKENLNSIVDSYT